MQVQKVRSLPGCRYVNETLRVFEMWCDQESEYKLLYYMRFTYKNLGCKDKLRGIKDSYKVEERVERIQRNQRKENELKSFKGKIGGGEE